MNPMKTTHVKDIMVSISEYATVDADASLQDAVLALNKTQAETGKKPFPHRNVLVIDRDRQILGKISQMDLIKGLEDGYDKIDEIAGVSRSGWDPHLIKTLMARGRLWERPLSDLCRKSSQIKVKDIMNVPAEGEYVEAGTTMDQAIHQMVMTRHHSLLVTQAGRIVGVLRLVDVLEMVGRQMAEC
jgi:CBS-domain-containing membrane protein